MEGLPVPGNNIDGATFKTKGPYFFMDKRIVL
jgi:hypothetical protein